MFQWDKKIDRNENSFPDFVCFHALRLESLHPQKKVLNHNKNKKFLYLVA